jgi:predicted enzyme related to lactoylglutathione lyase
MKKLISWVEIPAVDIERAVKFYNTIFNLDMEILDFGKEKMACFPNEEGAISLSPDFKPSEDGVLVSLNANEEMDITIEKIINAGVRLITPKTKIEADGKGFFAVFIDSEGNRIGLHSKS